MSENCLDPQTRKPRLLSAQCETCGWRWPLPGEPPVDAECDNCGGDLIEQED